MIQNRLAAYRVLDTVSGASKLIKDLSVECSDSMNDHKQEKAMNEVLHYTKILHHMVLLDVSLADDN